MASPPAGPPGGSNWQPPGTRRLPRHPLCPNMPKGTGEDVVIISFYYILQQGKQERETLN